MGSTIAPIPTAATMEQFGRAADRFTERCRKNAATLPRDITQDVLEQEGDDLAQEMFQSLRTRVERRSEMIVRHVEGIDRTLTPQQMVDATGRKQYVTASVLATMPTQGKTEDDVYFFPGKRWIPVAELAAEFAKRGLVPDHYAQLKVNIDDPSFADEHPNGSQWQDANGRFSYVTCSWWDDGRGVVVGQDDYVWNDDWWFAGVHKSSE